MNQRLKVAKKLVVFIVLFFIFMFAKSGFAQNKSASDALPQPMGLTEIKVKPGMDMEWESFLKKDMIPVLKKAGFKEMGVSKTNMFGEDSTYFFLWPVEGMAQFDGPDPIAAAMGPENVPVVLSVMQRTVSSSRTYLMAPVPELNIPPKEGYEVKMGVMARICVAPGRKDDYLKNSKEFIAALARTNAKAVFTANIVIGGNPNEFIVFVAFDSFADLGQFPQTMARVMEKTKLAPETGIIVHVENTVLKMAPELGIQPAGR